MITIEQLQKLNIDVKFCDALNETFEKFDISTPLRVQHFMAQVMHESGNFTRFAENLNYSEQGLLATFPKYFNAKSAKECARKPREIANIVYRNRMGNDLPNDGYDYRGRGAIQLTGKSLYILFFKYIKQDLNADLVAQLPLCIVSAGWYWYFKNLNHYADLNDIKNITIKINGGLNGFTDRQKNLTLCKKIIL